MVILMVYVQFLFVVRSYFEKKTYTSYIAHFLSWGAWGAPQPPQNRTNNHSEATLYEGKRGDPIRREV